MWRGISELATFQGGTQCVSRCGKGVGEVIPEFNHSFVLPPFVGEQLTQAQGSPYHVTALELVQRFATSPERAVILRGLLDYRAELRGLGFVEGFQWLDGSFVENVEAHQSRTPNDVDVVTFAHAPTGLSNTAIQAMMNANPDIFVKERCKERFYCDPMVINLNKRPEKLVQDVRYWYGLFSHRRGDHVWKGMLQLPLQSDDEMARVILDNMSEEVSDVATT